MMEGQPNAPESVVNLAEEELNALLGKQSALMLCLTIEGFCKFQLKRKPLGQDGTNAFVKAARNFVTVEKMDDLIACSIRYARHELEHHEVLSAWEEEPRAVVLEDLVKACARLAGELVAAAAIDLTAEASPRGSDGAGVAATPSPPPHIS